MKYWIKLTPDLERRRSEGDWRWVGIVWAKLFERAPKRSLHPSLPFCDWERAPCNRTLRKSFGDRDLACANHLPRSIFSRLDSKSSKTTSYACVGFAAFDSEEEAFEDLYRAVYCCLDSDEPNIWDPFEMDLDTLVLTDDFGLVGSSFLVEFAGSAELLVRKYSK